MVCTGPSVCPVQAWRESSLVLNFHHSHSQVDPCRGKIARYPSLEAFGMTKRANRLFSLLPTVVAFALCRNQFVSVLGIGLGWHNFQPDSIYSCLRPCAASHHRDHRLLTPWR